MGMIAAGVALAAVGAGAGAFGASQKSKAAKQKYKLLEDSQNKWLPDISRYQKEYFDDLEKYQGEANRLARSQGQFDLDTALALREHALPGSVEATRNAIQNNLDLAQGKFPSWMTHLFNVSSGANAFGTGFGGSGFGRNLAGLGSLDRAMAYQAQGTSLYQALLGAMPNVAVPTGSYYLNQLMNPQQRTQTQLQVRNQNLGLVSQMAGMPKSGDIWGDYSQSIGGSLFSIGAGMATGGMSGMGGGDFQVGNTMFTKGNTFDKAANANMQGAKDQFNAANGGGNWFTNLFR